MAIDPLSLPSAAGLNYGEGDVRHYSEGDAVSVAALSNPTRYLAQRDSILADKVNELVTEANNKEQIIPLPVYRTVIPASAEEIISNLRIPPGYEARVLSAAISSSPLSSNIELNIYWNNTFGNTTGDAVLTTSAEANGGTKFSSTGEFIIAVKNKGDTTLDIVASVTLTMRPTSAVTSALLPAPSLAPAGPPGPKGEKGEGGSVGPAGPAGSPGLVYRGQWARTPYPQNYSANDVVTHNYAGTSGSSSYVCLLPHIADDVNRPNPSLTPSVYWDFIAEAGPMGATGTVGAAGTTAIYGFATNLVQGTLWTSSDFVGYVYNSNYDMSAITPGRKYGINFEENSMVAPDSTPRGLGFLRASLSACFTGTVGIYLPSTEEGALSNYTWDSCQLSAIQHGSIATNIQATTVERIDDRGMSIVQTNTPTPLWINVSGNQLVY